MSNATEANRLFFQTSTTNGSTRLGVIPNGTQTASAVDVFNNSDPTNASFTRLRTSSTESQVQAAITGTGTYLPMTFLTGGSERMRLDTSGNVGIGTTGPYSKLSLSVSNPGNTVGQATQLFTTTATAVNDRLNINFSQTGVDGRARAGLGAVAELASGYASGLAFYTRSAADGSTLDITDERVRITASGNVGIGTASPSGKLQVTAANTRVRFSNTAGTASTLLFGADSGETFLGTETNAPIYFITNNTERMRIDSSGNVIVNTAAIATNATNGFLYVPTCAGTPTGTPTTYTGRAPIVVDTTNNKLYFYSGGQWRDAGP